MTAPTTKDNKLQQYSMLPFRSDEFKKHETLIENKKNLYTCTFYICKILDLDPSFYTFFSI